MKRNSLAVAAVIALTVCSCARFGKETIGMPQGITLVPVREAIVRSIPAGEMTDTPSFVTIPNPFSAFQAFPFHLPADAHVRIELRNYKGDEVATLADGPMRKGVYQIQVGGPNTLANEKQYTLRLIVDKKPVDAKDFSINRPELPRPGKKPAKMPQGVTIKPVDTIEPSTFSTEMDFYLDIPADGRARIEIRDGKDHELSALMDEFMPKGKYKLSFGSYSSTLAAGEYRLRLFVDDRHVRTVKFIILK